jgi:hypothetical protein
MIIELKLTKLASGQKKIAKLTFGVANLPNVGSEKNSRDFSKNPQFSFEWSYETGMKSICFLVEIVTLCPNVSQ